MSNKIYIIYLFIEWIGLGYGEFATCVLHWGREPSQGERSGQGQSWESKFKFAVINTKKYWKSVRLLLFTDLGCDTLTPAHHYTFVNNFERKGMPSSNAVYQIPRLVLGNGKTKEYIRHFCVSEMLPEYSKPAGGCAHEAWYYIEKN